jgi:hypothetical protein
MLYREVIAVCLCGCQGSVTDDRNAMSEQIGDKVTLAILRSLQQVARPLCALQRVHNSVIAFSFIDFLSSIFSLFETHRPSSPSFRHVSHWLSTEGGWYVPSVRLLNTIFRFTAPWSSRQLAGPAGTHRLLGRISAFRWGRIVAAFTESKQTR